MEDIWKEEEKFDDKYKGDYRINIKISNPKTLAKKMGIK